MRKVDDGEKKRKKKKKKKRKKKSLPVDRPNADRMERRTLVPKVGPQKFWEVY